MLDFSDKELVNKPGIIEDMVNDFGARFESGQVHSIEKYYKLLDDHS